MHMSSSAPQLKGGTMLLGTTLPPIPLATRQQIAGWRRSERWKTEDSLICPYTSSGEMENSELKGLPSNGLRQPNP